MTMPLDVTGQKFGRLTAIKRASNIGGKTAWLCKCNCGNTKIVQTGHLRLGIIQSCGCLHKEIMSAKSPKKATRTTHGLSKTPEYSTWRAMLARCENPKHKRYKDYGGRGITICAKWQTSFEAFYADMGPKPSLAHSIDRIDNNGNYEPKNCRWATYSEQNQNQRRYKKTST